jgi:hypothetical protein
MKKLVLTLAMVGALGMAPAPAPADATTMSCDVVGAVNSCNADFPPNNEYMVAIRGWCYLIRWCLF